MCACSIAAGLLCAAGCSAKAAKLAIGRGFSDDCQWRSGDALTIRGINGRIDVREASGAEVTAEFRPFVLIADDATPSEERRELEKLHGTVELDESSRTINVETVREGQVLSSLGADITVFIPSEFDGPLSVQQKNGPVVISSAAHASRLGLVSDSGSCNVNVGAAGAFDIHCGFGDLTGMVPVIPQELETATFETGRGEVELRFPAHDVFSVRAISNTGGLVDIINAAEAGCDVLVASDSSKTAVCNGATQDDPVYNVTADTASEAVLAHDVVLSFGGPSDS
jgi:hypothetical protein